MARDFYKILDVRRDADAEALKKGYREQARLHHPDRNDGDESAATRFKEIKQAYDFLSDPARRTQYDRLLSLQESGELDKMVSEARFRQVPFVPMEPFPPQPPRPVPPYVPPPPQIPYPTVPPDAHLHPETKGWFVAMPPHGHRGFMPNPYYDPVRGENRDSVRRGKEVLAELADLLLRKRW